MVIKLSYNYMGSGGKAETSLIHTLH